MPKNGDEFHRTMVLKRGMGEKNAHPAQWITGSGVRHTSSLFQQPPDGSPGKA
ncbi:hypothetical protein HMPREF0758_2611 [Serratia odorifera DSM 4582]|uniref:Uncharacterized protein n=1 Tax=Serratia odorifera DSM 4582 TaxID=667129 RepID=D4E361_SEROD|nr:hypothetical protein HMPREF0758_2611 [Serratia odorifera DSM 4582]